MAHLASWVVASEEVKWINDAVDDFGSEVPHQVSAHGRPVSHQVQQERMSPVVDAIRDKKLALTGFRVEFRFCNASGHGEWMNLKGSGAGRSPPGVRCTGLRAAALQCIAVRAVRCQACSAEAVTNHYNQCTAGAIEEVQFYQPFC